MNDIEYIADMIAGEANKCCYRSDGYREDIYKMALIGLRGAVLAEREACAKVCEDMADGALQAAEFAGRNAVVAYEEATECAAVIRARGDK